ncbi:uncharacterized protein LOC114882183 [Osmia bicornis bicornis]|uniref:uncharacterized protein LOC114882183 n=1 Tax=Osmia bicornis bicornis TaxID=1437191 RepID=UPI0010F517E1|nr:uncharacterized protein LOC114882183 [Osmia bicornis bicornis]
MPRRRERVAAAIMLLLNKKKKRSVWVRQWISRRPEFGCFHNLLRELQIKDGQQYFNLLRMTAVEVEVLLQKVGHIIQKEDTRMRDSISPKERLILTLRFLASGPIYSIGMDAYCENV